MRTIRPPYNKRPRTQRSGGRQIQSCRICRSKPSSPRRVKTLFQSDQSGQRTIDCTLTIPPTCLRHRGPREQPQRLRRSQLIDIAVTHRDCGRQPGHAEGADGTCLFEPFDHTSDCRSRGVQLRGSSLRPRESCFQTQISHYDRSTKVKRMKVLYGENEKHYH